MLLHSFGLQRPRTKKALHIHLAFLQTNPSLYIGVRPLDAQRLMTLSAFTAAGQTTANMYQGLLLSALRRVWRRQRRHTNIEDGDWKGNQSNKGIAAKATAGIMPMMLPPGRSR